MQHRPGRHVAETQVELDDVAGKGTVVEEGAVIDHVAGANPVIGQLVGVCEAALFKDLHVAEFQQVFSIVVVCDVNLVIVPQRILHPRSFVTAIIVMSDWL